MADTQKLRAVIAQVMKQLGSAGKKFKDEESRRTLLPALLRLEAITLDEAQPVLARLLGTAASSSGRYTLQDLQRASRALGVEDEPVAALAQGSSAPTSTASSASLSSTSSTSLLVPSEATVTPAPRPGYTRIVEAPVSSGMTGRPVPSTSRKMNSDWQQAQKTIKPGRPAPVLSSAPVVVTAAQEETSAASQGKSAATTSSNATWNTKNTATQGATPFATASGASASPQDMGKGKPGQAQASPAGNDGGQKNRKDDTGASKKTKGKANVKAATPKQQWFALIKDAGALQDLKRLATDPAVLNARDGAGKQQRGGLFHALVAGRSDVVAWLMAPETGYRLEQKVGPLLNAVCEVIDLVGDAQLQAIACFIDSLNTTASAELSTFFKERPALIAGVQNLLKKRGWSPPDRRKRMRHQTVA